MKTYKPFPTMQMEANYIKYLMIQYIRMHIAKIKVYVHWSKVSDTVPVMLYCRLEQNSWS